MKYFKWTLCLGLIFVLSTGCPPTVLPTTGDLVAKVDTFNKDGSINPSGQNSTVKSGGMLVSPGGARFHFTATNGIIPDVVSAVVSYHTTPPVFANVFEQINLLTGEIVQTNLHKELVMAEKGNADIVAFLILAALSSAVTVQESVPPRNLIPGVVSNTANGFDVDVLLGPAVDYAELNVAATVGNETKDFFFVVRADPSLLDSDGDGYTDDAERAAGTDPFDPNSHPVAKVSVPNVVGKTSAEGIQTLIAAGLATGVQSTDSSETVAAGLILRTNPSAGAKVAPGTAIDLVISTGSAIKPLSVQILSPVSGAHLTLGQVTHLDSLISGGVQPYTRIEWFSDVDGQYFYSLSADYTPTAQTASGTNKIYLFVKDSAGHELTKTVTVVVQ